MLGEVTLEAAARGLPAAIAIFGAASFFVGRDRCNGDFSARQQTDVHRLEFCLDAFRRISTDGDDARRQFVTAVKGHVDAIARKYIVPGEGTLDMALMFVPSESVYYELLMMADSKGQQLDSYCRSKKVIAVSPNTLYAHLCVIAMGLRGMQIKENAPEFF